MDNLNRLMRIFANILLLAVIGFVLLYLLPRGVVLFLPFLLALIVAAIVARPVRWLTQKLHVPAKLAALLAIILTVVIVGAVIYFFFYALVSQLLRLSTDWPSLYDATVDFFHSASASIDDFYIVLPEALQNLLDSLLNSLLPAVENAISNLVTPALSYVTDFARRIPGMLIFLVMLLLASFFIASDRENLNKTLHDKLPASFMQHTALIWKELKSALGGYIRAQGMLMTIVFVELLIGMRIIGNPYGLLIALLVAIFDAIPFFGSGGVLIPWGIVSFFLHEPRQAVVLLVTYGCIVLTRQFLEPRILGGQIGLHPLLTLMGMFVGLRLLGAIGLIVGPVTVLIVKKLIEVGLFDPIWSIFRRIWEDLRAVCGIAPVTAGSGAAPPDASGSFPPPAGADMPSAADGDAAGPDGVAPPPGRRTAWPHGKRPDRRER